MSDYSSEDMLKLAKFFISTNLYQFTVFYSQNFDILFNFESTMASASEELKIAASELLQSDDLMYENVKLVRHESNDIIAVYEGNRIRVVLLLAPQAMIPVVEQTLRSILKEFSDTFEDKYRKELKDYEHFSGSFTNIQEIFANTFVLDLGLPHIAKYKGFAPEEK